MYVIGGAVALASIFGERHSTFPVRSSYASSRPWLRPTKTTPPRVDSMPLRHVSPRLHVTVQERRFVRMFIATTLPMPLGLPGVEKSPSIWKKLPRGFSVPGGAGGSAFHAPKDWLAQMYVYPVRWLKLDGGHSLAGNGPNTL